MRSLMGKLNKFALAPGSLSDIGTAADVNAGKGAKKSAPAKKAAPVKKAPVKKAPVKEEEPAEEPAAEEAAAEEPAAEEAATDAPDAESNVETEEAWMKIWKMEKKMMLFKKL